MKNYLVRVELVEEIPARKRDVVEERRHDGFVIECAEDRDQAKHIFEDVHSFLEREGHELMTVDPEEEFEEQG